MNVVRPPAVAGLFYPGEPRALRSTLHAMLAGAPGSAIEGRPKLLIVPHAGYVYSGRIAASAYGLLKAQRARVRRVILLGPTHRVAVRGVAISSASGFATPLGVIELDSDLMARLRRHPSVVASDVAHAAEHSLEVQLPFLQIVLTDFTLVPLAVGNIADDQLADLLGEIWGDEETLVVVSSDLSHYRSYSAAQEIDRVTVDRILACAGGIDHEHACGATPINAALAVASRAGLQARLLAMGNSGDTAGDRARVVGYCAIAFEPAHDARH